MHRTVIGRQSFTGRGALSNPPGRFDKRQLASVDDGWYQEEVPESINTTIEPDRAREVISTNDSPDIPFEQSINPYRGCETACIYCGAGHTRVLMVYGGTKELARLQQGDLIYGTVLKGEYRGYVGVMGLGRGCVVKPAYRVRLEDGTELTVGNDHRFL